MSSLRLTLSRLLSSCSIGFCSAGVYGGQAEPLTMVTSPPRPGVSLTDLKVCFGKLTHASSMPGPVPGRSALGAPALAVYVGSRLASLVVPAPATGGGWPALGAGALHALSTPEAPTSAASPAAVRKNARRLKPARSSVECPLVDVPTIDSPYDRPKLRGDPRPFVRASQTPRARCVNGYVYVDTYLILWYEGYDLHERPYHGRGLLLLWCGACAPAGLCPGPQPAGSGAPTESGHPATPRPSALRVPSWAAAWREPTGWPAMSGRVRPPGRSPRVPSHGFRPTGFRPGDLRHLV